jgi:hypothetical protein
MQSTHQRTVRGLCNYMCVCGLAPTVDSRLLASALSRPSLSKTLMKSGQSD